MMHALLHIPLATCALVLLLGSSAPPASHSAITPVPRDAGWWHERHEQINARARKGDIDLVFLGDSITEFWNEAGQPAWDKYYAARKTLNAGARGDRTQHLLWRFENGALSELQPRLVVLMIGTNNVLDNSPDQIADGIVAIVKRAQATWPRARLLLLPIFPRGIESFRERSAAASAQAASRVMDDNVLYLDIAPVFLDQDGTLNEALFKSDQLHLNGDGYKEWARAIEPTVRQLLNE